MPGCFTVRAPCPRQTVSGIPGHEHRHPHNSFEAPRQLCEHRACSAPGQDWSGAGVTVVSSDLYAHVGRCWELPDAGASGIGDTAAAPVPFSCSAQGPQGQAATYIEQSMHGQEPLGDQRLKASLRSAHQPALPSMRPCLPKEGASFSKHTKALYELAGLCPGAHGDRGEGGPGPTPAVQNPASNSLLTKPPLGDF